MQKAKRQIALLMATVMTLVSAIAGLTIASSAATVTVSSADTGYKQITIDGYIDSPSNVFVSNDSLQTNFYEGSNIFLGYGDKYDVKAKVDSFVLDGYTRVQSGGYISFSNTGLSTKDSLGLNFPSYNIRFTVKATFTESGTAKDLGLNLNNFTINNSNYSEIAPFFNISSGNPAKVQSGYSRYVVTNATTDDASTTGDSLLFNSGKGIKIYSGPVSSAKAGTEFSFGSTYGLTATQRSDIAAAGKFSLTVKLQSALRETDYYTLRSDLVSTGIYQEAKRGTSSLVFDNIDPRYFFDADSYQRYGGRSIDNYLFSYLNLSAGTLYSPNFDTITLDYSGSAGTAAITSATPAAPAAPTPGTPSGASAVDYTMNFPTFTLATGSNLQLTTTAPSPSWFTSDTSVLTVYTNGKVLANKAGVATITAKTADGKSWATSTITVKDENNPIQEFSFPVSTGTIYVGKTYSSFTPAKCDVFPEGSDSKVLYKSSAPTIVAVDSKGVIKGVKSGKAVITATTSSGVVAKATITVKLPTLKLSSTTAKIAVGKTKKITFTAAPKLASSTGVTISSSKSGIVTATKTATSVTIKGTKKGTTTVTVKANGVSAKVAVTVS
ncbi:hypothetical protein FACS1894120_5990 [Clostridia bacterium]|nr:hypothetical protein FACS1894120_5990 [Clostridia bacterium]